MDLSMTLVRNTQVSDSSSLGLSSHGRRILGTSVSGNERGSESDLIFLVRPPFRGFPVQQFVSFRSLGLGPSSHIDRGVRQ